MKSFELPIPNFSLKSSEHSFNKYTKQIAEITEELAQKAQTVGSKSDAYKQAYIFLRKLLCFQNAKVSEVVTKPIYIRAFGGIITNENYPISAEDLEYILQIREKFSLLFLVSLKNYFFKFYDKMPKISKEKLGECLYKQYSKRPNIKENKNLFASNAINVLLNKTIQNNLSLEKIFEQEKITPYKGGRFCELLQIAYYIIELEKLQPNQESSLLDEVSQPKVYESSYKQGQLGHEILRILIDKVEGAVSDRWCNVILKIAGDPRVSSQAENYRRWWQVLGEERVAKVRSWLSKVDIELFLKIFDKYAIYENNEDMRRMYSARKTFLLGLLKQKKVLNTRLYLSQEIETFIKSYFKDVNISFVTLTGANMAIIYLDLGRGIAMVEGTHSFKNRIYKNIHKQAKVFNYSLREVHKDSLMNLPCDDKVAIPHQGLWQAKVIGTLNANGVGVNPKEVLDANDYKTYSWRYGSSYGY